MIKLYNATAHDQTPFLDRFRQLGFEVVNPAPQVRAAAPTFEAQVAEGKRVASSIPDGSNVLIGGAQIIVEAIVSELSARNCRFYAALSERERDEKGNFLFNLKSVVETVFSKMLKEGKIKIK